MRDLLSATEVVGYHWFQHSDQPARVRFDGQKSNYGLVDGADRPYEPLVSRVAEVNRAAEGWHRRPPA